MTSELTAEAPRAEPSAASSRPPAPGAGAARLHLRISLIFLALGSLALAVAAGRLALPDAASGVSVLSYGRLAPVAFDLLAYGWLTIGLIGAGYYIVPRMAGRPLAHERLAVAGGGLLAVGVLAGAVAVALGANEGRQYLEFPLWADAVILVGLAAVVAVFTSTIAADRTRSLAPAEWFFGSAPVWLLLAYIVGNIPGLIGVDSVLQTTFYRGALFGMWLAAAAVGVVYFLAAELAGRDPRRFTQLAVIGFWSVGFVFALSSGSRLTYTAAPDWAETLGAVFSIALLLPVAVIVVDLAATLRGVRGRRGRSTLHFLVAGAVAFAAIPIVNVALALRSSSAVVGLTDWVGALDALAVIGAFSFWLFAFVHHVAVPEGKGTAHYRLTVLSVAVFVGTLLVSGVQAGLSWVAAANAGDVSAGDGFRATVGGADGQLWVRFAALAVFALAQLALVAAARDGAAPAGGAAAAEPVDASGADDDEESGGGAAEDEADDVAGLPAGAPVPLERLRVATIGIFVAVAVFAFGFPALEAENLTATGLADTVRDYGGGGPLAEGRSVYLAEGCWYCHTQEVRGIVTDARLGPVAQAGDYAHEAPSTAGVMRAGPDLTYVGSRDVTADWVRTYLVDPRSVRPWSTMPAYDYLSAGDLNALAAYVASLRRFDRVR